MDMKIRLKRTAFMTGLCLCLAVGITMVSFATEIDDTKTELSNLEEKKKETEKKIKGLEKEKDDIINYIEKLDQQLAGLTQDIDKLGIQIGESREKAEETRKALKEAKEIEKKQYVTMKKRIKYMYENGTEDYLAILFESKSLGDLLNRNEYIVKISEYDKNLLEKYGQTKEIISQKEKELEEELRWLESLNEQAEYEKAAVEQLAQDKGLELSKQEQAIASSKEEEAGYSEEIEKQEQLLEELLEQERQRIEEEIRAKEEARKAEEARKKQQENETEADDRTESQIHETDTRGFRWPLNVEGTLTSYFGGRNAPTEGASSNHKGIDIAVPVGTPVFAAASGSVATSSYQAAAGNYIMIYHGDSTYTVYMHCSQLLAEAGDSVSQGDVIAYSGSTGVSTGPHLHFGISINGSYVNPLDYVGP